ncbi:CHAT domain-containing protein [Confluentibacter sediminis]|uniref:CHAT domain-containing protein n=1 Tax=Confluentibacter sediminis TaxID=2219045 RepID=UPI000DAE90DB|nr:CHAT domain-containing protein [Confluentibacter sediminis]
MRQAIIILLYFFSGISFSQNLEEAIYEAAETFISNKNDTSLKLLNTAETTFKTKVKTKDEQLALVFLQCNKAYYLKDTGHLKDAITSYEEASKRFFENQLSTLSDFDITESCLKPLGNLYTQTGDFTNAISTINKYILLAETNNNKTQQTSGIINLAKLYQSKGEHGMVIKITDTYLNHSTINKSQRQKLMAINTASQIALKHISSYDDIPNTLKDITKYKIELDKGNYTTAFSYFKNVKASLLQNKDLPARDLAKTYFEEAQLYYLLKNNKEAILSLHKAIKTLLPNFNENELPNKEYLYAENTFIDIFDLYATLQTNPKIALESLDLSFYVSELLQNNWTSQENKIRNQSDDRIRSEKYIDILFNEYHLTKNKDFIIKAFQYAENNKASVLKEIFRKKMQLQRYPNDSLLIKEFNLLKEQELKTSLLIKEQLGNAKAATINSLSQELTSISVQLKTLKTIISKKHPLASDPISIEELQQKLKNDKAVLVEYFYGKNTLYQFIITENNIILEDIDLNDEAKKNIVNFIHFFENPSAINNDIGKFTAQAYKLFQFLNFDDIDTRKNVIIIPDGLLNFIPFEALLSEPTNTSSYSKMPFVVKSQTIAYNSSSQLYLNSSTSYENNKLLGIFPVFENSQQPLSFSLNEAKAIENVLRSKILLKTQATKNHFIENAKEYGILHLSTHASSGDFVIPAHIEFYEDTMLLNELYSLNLNSNLVVLSACETGIGRLYKGEGSMSIARGFQYAGVQNLLFSLWQINDLSTSQIMQSFYKNYVQHQSAYFANHFSKIDYLENESISNEKKSPYYWSAFVFYGSLEPQKTSNTLFYIIFGILILSIAIFLVLNFKK